MSDTNQSSVNNVIVQAEILQAKLKMQMQYKSNLEFFKSANKLLYDKFVDYSAKAIWPIMTEEGYIQLINSVDNSPVYPKDPREYSIEVVENYLKHPWYVDLNPGDGGELDAEEDRSHVIYMHKMIDEINSLPEKKVQYTQSPKSIRTLMMKGIGLGYQISHLLQRVDIHYLCLIEPNLDIFFASMHIIDYEKIFSLFNRKGYGLNIVIDSDRRKCVDAVIGYMLSIGVYNCTRIYEFDHLCSDEVTQSSSNFSHGIVEAVRALGFFDDEQVGLAHSVHNFKQKYPILRMSDYSIDTPVFIVGNGPSLDAAKDFLLENQDKAIIISGGSTLSSLYKMGIKPDFHVENERILGMHPWVEKSSDRAYRDDLIFLALNTVHPKVMGEFKNIGIALKPNDLGTTYFLTKVGTKDFAQLMNCNPTVSNTSFSMACHMGFKNIYLIGIDMGFSPDGEHHSKYSLYTKIDDDYYEDKSMFNSKAKDNLTAKGNFVDWIRTTVTLRNSAQVIELLAEFFSGIKVYNTSNGLYINRAEPTKLEDIKLEPLKEDKKILAQRYFDAKFKVNDDIESFEEKEVLASFRQLELVLPTMLSLVKEEVNSYDEAYEKLDHINNLLKILLKDKKNMPNYFLLKGSILTVTVLLSKALNIYDEETGLEMFKKCLGIFEEFIKDIDDRIKNHLLEWDHFSLNSMNIYLSEDKS